MNERNYARFLRISVLRNLVDVGVLTETDAKELLAGPLTPGDDSTIVDDSVLFSEPLEKIFEMLDKE
ncbi:MAG: hypothetical protein P4L50_15900 [Anaerolineaceae bacterium]|nr:hypothetical protein [Anaerolineaceae bacterium]